MRSLFAAKIFEGVALVSTTGAVLLQQPMTIVMPLLAGYAALSINGRVVLSQRLRKSQEISAQASLIEPKLDGQTEKIVYQTVSDTQLLGDRNAFRKIVLQSLDQVQEHLVLVCPWLGHGLTADIESMMVKRLRQGVHISLGFGYRRDIEKGILFFDGMKVSANHSQYSKLSFINSLASSYPDNFHMKVIGTHEKYLVCDRRLAMLGSHNYLSSIKNDAEREVGLSTTDPGIIDKLLKRFENAPDIFSSSYVRNSKVLKKTTIRS